jgi:hypothetical protein
MNVIRILRAVFVLAAVTALSVTFGFAGKKKEQHAPKEQPKVVDSGSFGIFVNGNRIATETFKIEQSESGSVVNSEFKTEEGIEKVRQTAELRMALNGDLLHYGWREESPGKGQITVEPSSEFLMEHVVPDGPEKPSSIPLLVSLSTSVLDDYFFSQREVLIWKYMAQNCGAKTHTDCTMPKIQFGVLIPRQRSTASASVEYRGKEQVTLKGAERMLDRFDLNVEGDDWAIYLDENLKVLKIVVPSAKTEVVRD